MNAVTRAISIVGLVNLAGRMDVTYQAIRKWERHRIPAERCHEFVSAVDIDQPGAITIHDLRPDLFGPAPGVPPALPVPLKVKGKAA